MVRYRSARVPFADPAYVGRAALLRVDAPDRSFRVNYLGTTQSAQDARSICGPVLYLVSVACDGPSRLANKGREGRDV